MQVIDYKVVIEDLERKREAMNARFDAAVSALRQVSALENVDLQPAPPGVVTAPLHNSESRGGPYQGLSMLDAAVEHIKSVGHAVPNLELAKALEDGGYRHKSKNFPNTLNSVLWRRAKSVGDVRKSPKGWQLASAD